MKFPVVFGTTRRARPILFSWYVRTYHYLKIVMDTAEVTHQTIQGMTKLIVQQKLQMEILQQDLV